MEKKRTKPALPYLLLGRKIVQGSSLYASSANVAKGNRFMPYPSSSVAILPKRRQNLSTVQMQQSFPAAAPIQSASWLPQVKSKFWYCMRASIIICAPGPLSQMSPSICIWSMARRWITWHMAVMKFPACPVCIMLSMIRLK